MRIIDEKIINKVTLNNICRLGAGIRCKTEVEAYKLLSYFDKFGIKWYDGQRAIDTLNYRYGSDTCYMFDGFSLTYADAKALIKKDSKVFDFNAVLLDGKKPENNEKNLFKVLGIECNERFKLTGYFKEKTFYIDSDLRVHCYDDDRDTSFPAYCGSWYDMDMVLDFESKISVEASNQLIKDIITAKYSIIKISKEEQK